jgi:hypothetical protein
MRHSWKGAKKIVEMLTLPGSYCLFAIFRRGLGLLKVTALAVSPPPKKKVVKL